MAAPRGRDRRALWALAEAVATRPAWRLTNAAFGAEWTVDGWRATVLTSLFFGDSPREPAAVFGIHVTPVTPRPRSRAALARSAWFKRLVDALGSRYCAELPKHAPPGGVRLMTRLGTADLRKVLRELDRVATAIAGKRTAIVRPPGPARPTLFAVCESIATSAGPWRLESLFFTHEESALHAGRSWTISLGFGCGASYDLPAGEGPGCHGLLMVMPDGGTRGAGLEAWPWYRQTERALLRAGYRLIPGRPGSEDAVFTLLLDGLARRRALRELDRLQRLGKPWIE